MTEVHFDSKLIKSYIDEALDDPGTLLAYYNIKIKLKDEDRRYLASFIAMKITHEKTIQTRKDIDKLSDELQNKLEGK